MRVSRARTLSLCIAALFAAHRLSGFPVAFGGMACDLPEGWSVLSSSEGMLAATSNGMASGTGVFQVTWFSPGAFGSASDILGSISQRLNAEGDVSEFLLDGRVAVLADLGFVAGGIAVRGYLLCIDAAERDVALLAYADEAGYEAQHDFLLSALDSFRMSAGAQNRPGPISQFLAPFPPEGSESEGVEFRGSAVPVARDPQGLDAMQALIEREARILVWYAQHPGRDEAWKRYYRLIYRDGYPRLEGTSRAIGALTMGSPADRATAVLSWLQGFGYARTGSLSDLQSPPSSLLTRTGDCDARALAFVIIMSHLGVDGVILVSSVYAHSVAAVAVDGPGLALVLDGRRYLTAETTKKAPLGWIAEEQRDLSKWVVVSFEE